MKHLLGWIIGIAMVALRWTCQYRYRQDPRPGLRDRAKPYVYAGFHAQQVAAIISSERGAGAMVSRSSDGDVAVPMLKLAGFVPVRGSSGRKGKGGATALQNLIRYMVPSGRPVALTIDGPRGPRGKVQPGVALLAKKADAVILPLLLVPTRRWIFRSSWDRMQIPQPFSRIDVYFHEPIVPLPNESTDDLRGRVEQALSKLEHQYDPDEAQYLYQAKTDQSLLSQQRNAA